MRVIVRNDKAKVKNRPKLREYLDYGPHGLTILLSPSTGRSKNFAKTLKDFFVTSKRDISKDCLVRAHDRRTGSMRNPYEHLYKAILEAQV